MSTSQKKAHHTLALTTDQWDAVTDRANELLDRKRVHGLTAVSDDSRITMAAVGAAIQAYLDLELDR